MSGIAAIRLLAAKGAKPVVLEGNEKADREQVVSRIPEGIGYDLIIGNLPEEVMDTLDLAVLSPGVPTDLPFVIKLQDKKIPVWGEIELAYACGSGRLVAITGTNGKTTTTALTGAILREYYDSVFVVGNIGLPYTEYALEMKDSSVDGCRGLKLPARNDPYISAGGQCDLKYHTGSSEPPSYDGVLH